jgi:hypothetical protein
METLEQRIQRVAQEDVAITPYDPRWPELFRQEKGHLLNCLPNELIRRIEHFGSTAVPGLAAKGTKLTNFSSGQSCLLKGYQLFGAALGLELLRWFFDDAVVWRR